MLKVAALAFLAAWGMNDVSILVPLPSPETWDQTLGADSQGAKGVLYPRSVLDEIPILHEELSPEQQREILKVVAIRVDPCFSNPCRPQLRLIWQPLSARETSEFSTLDAASHTFYDLTSDEFDSLARALRDLNESGDPADRLLPLGVNPRLAREGLQGPYWQKLKSLILTYAGERNFSRATFAALRGHGSSWRFGGFEVQSGKTTPLAIPRVSKLVQIFTNVAMPKTYFRGSVAPSPQGADQITPVLGTSTQVEKAEISLIRQWGQSSQRIENPSLHSADDLDCVSCHLAGAARHWLSRTFSDASIWDANLDFQPASSWLDLRNQSPVRAETDNVRAFGYLGNQPAFSQRTINEAAETAERMNAAWPAKNEH
jgi:hypothetical protein